MGKQDADFEEELDLDVDAGIDDDDLDLEIDDGSSGDGRLQSTSKRVRMIFSVMASPNRIDILRILNSKGPLTYSELKSLAGFKSKKESGKMYVRTSHDSIEEFNSDKIIQSLVREGSLPLELSQKITEEVENRIYKFQTTYLTGSLIREMVNNVLLEHGHEEYRNKLARLGMPVFEVQEMFTNVENIRNGVEDVLFTSGKNTLAEYLLTNTLPKDIADSHLSGELHISNLGLWSLIPDTIFLNLKELIDDGIDLKGKCPDVTRVSSPKTLDDLRKLLPMIFNLVSKESSQEIVIDDLTTVLGKFSKTTDDLEKMLVDVFTMSSTSTSLDKSPTVLSFRIPLSGDKKLINTIFSAYNTFVKSTPAPKIGLVIDYEKGKVIDHSEILAQTVSLGGNITFSKGMCSTNAIKNSNKTSEPSIKLGSLTINLPRLALESSKDETYFRARLVLLMKPAIAAMATRKKDVSDLIRRGVNPILAEKTQFMQKNNTSIVLNFVGLKEAVHKILGHKEDKEGKEILNKVLQTAVDIAHKKGQEMGIDVSISMVDSDDLTRFVTLDSEKYGKNSIMDVLEGDLYSQGLELDSTGLDKLTAKSEIISDYNKISKILDGGVLVKLPFDTKAKEPDIKKAIEKASLLISSFKPIK